MTQHGMFPVYRIEVWEPGGGSALYTFGNTSTDIPRVLNWYYKDVCTDGVGYFAFTIPTKKGSSYIYNDIELFDTVKIYHGYTTLPGTANFIGKVYDISAPHSPKARYSRIIGGLSQSEILLRRLKRNMQWFSTDTSEIVHTLADDLSIYHAADVEAETSHPAITVESETYFDLLRRISDYWVNAGTQIKFDFNVEVDGHLHWHSRPWRTSGVPTFTIGQDILDYTVSGKLNPVKNDITVYGEQGRIDVPGAEGRCEPSDKDGWTFSDTWTALSGATSSEAVQVKIGATSLQLDTADFGGGDHHGEGRRDIATYTVGIGHGKYQTVNFWSRCLNANATHQVRLYAPDTSNYFYATIPDADWGLNQFQLGENQEYNVDTNPNAPWHKQGSPIWGDIDYVGFYIAHTLAYSCYFDGLYFGHGRWRSTATDATSDSAYGNREVDVIDNVLRSDSECEQRAKTLVYQLKDPPRQIEVSTHGDNNILVGDRVSMTIPAENISAANYDIFSVEQMGSNKGYFAHTTMVNSASIREPVQVTQAQALASLRRQVKHLTTSMQRIG